MKRVIIFLLCLPLLVNAQEEKKPSLHEVLNIEVIDGQEDAFEAAVKAHNAKFHPKDGQYHARLFYNINGPSGGLYTWIMGPTSWTAQESRPGEGEHDEDWKTVDAMVEKYHSPTFWNLDRDLSHLVEGQENDKRVIWAYDIASGKSDSFKKLTGQVKEVYDAKRPTETFVVAWNEFADTKAGMDAVFVFPFNEWSWMDRESTFKGQYEEVHGEGTFATFIEEFGEAVDGRVDWLRTLVK